MIKLSAIANNSTIILTGTIIPEKMDMIEGILKNNFEIFKKFKHLILNINCTKESDWQYAIKYEKLLLDLLDGDIQIYLLRDYINRGWQFGTIDLEKTAYSFYKRNLKGHSVLKLDFDIYLQKQILDLDIETHDIYFMPSVGYSPVEHGSSTILKEFENETWDILQPQSTIYIIKKQLDYLYVDQDWLNKKYKEWILNPIGNGPHHIGVACEPLLRKSFERNSCKMKSMISSKTFNKLIETIQVYKMHDPSHKNILFEEVGVCHLYDNNNDIISI
jgi:hypothetical protein